MSQFITEGLFQVQFLQELTFLALCYKYISYTWSLLLSWKTNLYFPIGYISKAGTLVTSVPEVTGLKND